MVACLVSEATAVLVTLTPGVYIFGTDIKIDTTFSK
jgi:hypothetical protein